jgi:hypothetical protein
MYTRIINNQPTWPYTPAALRADEPGTSFPETISEELLNEYQVFQVHIDAMPETTYQQDATRQDPVFKNGQWVQHWLVTNASAEIVQDRYESQCAEIRNIRNIKLTECDWTQGKDIPDSVSLVWQGYRQQLRDLTSQNGFPFSVEWPIAP